MNGLKLLWYKDISKEKRVNGGCCFSGKRASSKAVPSSAHEGMNYMNWGTEDNV